MNREFIRFDLHSLPFVVKKIEAHCKMHNSNHKRLKNKFLCLSMTYTDKAMMTGIIILKQDYKSIRSDQKDYENLKTIYLNERCSAAAQL